MHHVVALPRNRGPIEDWKLANVKQLLDAASRCESPCVKDDGSVFVPDWLDRRQAVRYRTNIRVWLEFDGDRCQATVQDISISGMGLACQNALSAGTVITARLQNDRELVGRIVWAGNAKLGVSFLMPLAPNDPLVSGVA